MSETNQDILLMQIKDMLNELGHFTKILEQSYSRDYEELRKRIEALEQRR